VFAASTPQRTLPVVPGWDFAGRVLEAAEGFSAGQRVFGMIPWFSDAAGRGSYAETLSVEPGWLAALPDDVDDERAAAVAMNGLTALQAIDLAGEIEGRTIAITGVSGAVGAVAAHVAVQRGAAVIAVASDDDREFVASLSPAAIVSRGSDADVAAAIRTHYPDGVDVVLDAAAAAPGLIAAVRDGGRFVAVTDPAQPVSERGIETATVHTEPDAAGLGYLASELAAGRLPARVSRTLPLADAADAHRLIESGAAGRGKTVLVS
jgi:NADPH:quinone reductase